VSLPRRRPSFPAAAAVLAFWDPAGTVDSTIPLPPTSVSPGISASNLSGGPGLTSPGLFANAYEFDNWSSGAFDANDYLAFSTTGTNVTYQSVAFSLYNNFDGTGRDRPRRRLRLGPDSGAFSGIFAGGLLITANVGALGVQSGTVHFASIRSTTPAQRTPLQRNPRHRGLGQGLTVKRCRR
jgi:hypothetical protein